MPCKIIKNEQWLVKELISKIKEKDISKPQFQRKKKWDLNPKPKRENVPNEESYIKFLYETGNSVHAITFGDSSNNKYSNIDGNNRINAIIHFMEKPFEIFKYYLDDLDNSIEPKIKEQLKEKFKEMSYEEIIDFNFSNLINIFSEDLMEKEINKDFKKYNDYINKIKEKFFINKNERFDTSVRINVNLFTGYTTKELCKTFEDINKFNNKLTETELLACRLFGVTNFEIKNNFKDDLIESIKEYYQAKAEGEILECYQYEDQDKINAHDFIVGLQHFCSKRYEGIIEKTSSEGLSLFFKLYFTIYDLDKKDDELFSTNNVNNFIEEIIFSCNILKKTIDENIFNKFVNEKLFNKKCIIKFKNIKKNNLFLLICSIIGYKRNKEEEITITKSVEKCLLFNTFIKEVKEKTEKEKYKNYDFLSDRGAGKLIENKGKKLLDGKHENISKDISKQIFSELIDLLINETNKPDIRSENGKIKNKNRRNLKFFEKTIIFYFYSFNIPSGYLSNNFSIEHICPNSSLWEGKLDKDRTGNLIPIIDKYNSKRSNKHIKIYKDFEKDLGFFKSIENIIPTDDVYDKIIEHEPNKNPKIINIERYIEMCEKNEKIYKEVFIKTLFN